MLMRYATSCLLAAWLATVAQADLTPAEMLNNFCPCLVRAACGNVLGGDGQAGLLGLLEAIPACPARTFRCCTQDRMFNAITQIMNLFGPQQQPVAPPPGADQVDPQQPAPPSRGRLVSEADNSALDDFDYSTADGEEDRQDGDTASNSNGAVVAPPGSSQVTASTAGSSSVPGLVCVPVAMCPVPNIYGTRPAHFLRFGFVSPSAVRCNASAGQILCVQEPPQQQITSPTPVPTSTEASATKAGTETTAPATITTAAGTPPPPPVQALECLRVADCAEVFGTLGEHFARFGEQAACANGLVRCVTARPAVTTGAPEETTTATAGATAPTPPIFTPGLPVGPVAPSVSIIGPQPIYVSYNNVVGPSVGGCCSGGSSSPGVVSSAGVSPNQEQEINSLLQNLRTRLQGIITAFRSS